MRLSLAARIQAGWHLYALQEPSGGPIATTISLAETKGFKLGSVTGTKPQTSFDPNFEMQVGLYSERAEFTLPVTILPDAPIGSQTLTVQVRYQACNDKICLPPKAEKLTVQIDVRGSR